jgi:hypothetical protein
LDKRLGFGACLVIGLASFFALDLMADGNPPAVKTRAGGAQQMQRAMQMRQYQQMHSQLLQKYQERQNISAALQTIEKNRMRLKEQPLSRLYENTLKTENTLKQRQQVLATEIRALESQLKN